jgi:hypothetical protein
MPQLISAVHTELISTRSATKGVIKIASAVAVTTGKETLSRPAASTHPMKISPTSQFLIGLSSLLGAGVAAVLISPLAISAAIPTDVTDSFPTNKPGASPIATASAEVIEPL